MEHEREAYQYLPCLSLDEYEALRESIRENGVIEPVVTDENGAVIDGHHRVKVCAELGIEYPVRVIEGLTEEQKQDLSLELNMHRRHLAKEQKREIAVALRDEGWTLDRIAKALGVVHATIINWLKNVKIDKSAQLSPNLNQDELLSLKTQLEGAAERAETFKREIERLRAEKPQIVERVVEKPVPVDDAEIERLISERVAEKTGALERARRWSQPCGERGLRVTTDLSYSPKSDLRTKEPLIARRRPLWMAL